MHSGIFATTQPVVFVPVRHHSPACARAVRDLALTLRPAAILIEGPSDFNDRIDELYLPHTLPIAIYSYVRLQDTRRGAFYPFCEHSPEWAALQVARELGVAARFIDLPWANLAASRTPTHRYADSELRDSPYIPTLCDKLGVEDFDSLWDTLVEIDPSLTTQQILERVHHLCYHIRASANGVAQSDLRREAFMVEQIRTVLGTTGGPLLVITGGFHSYALYAQLNELPSPEFVVGLENSVALIDDGEAADDEQAEDVERGLALTPYSDARLDNLAGYEAGMPSPGFYRRIWRDRLTGQRETYRHLLSSAVLDLRNRGQIASTADLIAVETNARSLAALRGHADVWRQDLVDAITGALIKEVIEPDTRHPFLDALLTVFRGDGRGMLAEGVNLPPLVLDIQQQLQQYTLEPATQPRQIRLDLAIPADLVRSRVLHKLRTLGIRGFARRDGTDLVGRGDLTTIWETWEIVWTPDFDAACIEAAIYGATLEEAAAAQVMEQAAALERNAERAALLVLDAALMGLSVQLDALFDRLIELVRGDADFFSVAGALGHLLYLYRYDDTLGVVGRANIGALLIEAFGRAVWLLETLGQPQGQDKQLLRAFRALVQTFEACETQLSLNRQGFADVLRRSAGDTTLRPLVRGASTGALWTLGEATSDHVRTDLRTCATPEKLGDFLTGLFALARETVQRQPALVDAIDELVLAFDDAEYLEALPALRLAFSFFTPREKHYIGHTLMRTHDESSEPLPELTVDVKVAARAFAVDSWLLDTLARYGIRGGQQ